MLGAGGAGHPDGGRRSPGGRTRLFLILGVVAALVLVAVGGTALLLVSHRGDPSPDRSAAASPATSSSTAPAATSAPPSSAMPSAASSSPSAASFPALYQQVSDGVVRIETTACDGGGVGTGFLIAPDLVATVAHVVHDGVSIAVRAGSRTTTGKVIGIDRQADLALVRTSASLSGHVFDLDTSEPQVGVDVGAIGYPLGGQESLTKGAISGLDRTIDVGNGPLRGLIQTDAGINPGNSGGPLLDIDGTVVGIVDAKRTDASNIGFAIPAEKAQPSLRGWTTAQPVDTGGECDVPTAPDSVDLTVHDNTQSVDGAAIADMFSTYANAINDGDYSAAYDVLSPREQGLVSPDDFANGNQTSFIVTFDVDSVEPTAAGDEVEARFTSVQEPSMGPRGQSCSEWTMTYSLSSSAGSWLIDRAQPHTGSPNAC